MRIANTQLTLMILFVLILLVSCSGKPRIEFAELSYDFGDIPQYSTVSHWFTFSNIGDSILEIKKIRSS